MGMIREPRRLGRPPKVKAADTRQFIIDVARGIFAQRGYDLTTNKEIADAAGVTTSALYYHFSSKRDLYFEVYADAQLRIYERFNRDMAKADTFADKLRCVLDSAHAMNGEDPTLSRFAGAVRVDIRRHGEMFDAYIPGNSMRSDFFDDLVGIGIATGEIRPERREQINAVLLAFLTGLNDSLSDDQAQHQMAIDGINALLDGQLLHAPHQQPQGTVARRSVGTSTPRRRPA